MLAVFRVGKQEIHTVEVFSSFWRGKEIVKVDGKVVISKQKLPIWFTDHMHFEVGEAEIHEVDLKYSAVRLSSRAYVDKELYVGCLFPEVIAWNAILISLLALTLGALALGLAILSI